MAFYKNYFLIIMIFSFSISATDYRVSLNTERIKKTHFHKLSIIDKTTDKVVKELELASSYKKNALLLRRDNSPYIFFYTENKSPTGLVQIINLDELSISHEIVIGKMTQTQMREKTYNYMGVTKDGQHLVAQVGKKKFQKLINIDAVTGKIIKKINLGKKKTLVRNGDEIEYIWTRLLKNSSGNTLTIYRANTLEKIQSIELKGKIASILSSNNSIFIKEKIIDTKKPQNNKYTINVFDINKKKLHTGFSSSDLPLEYVFDNDVFILVGTSITSPQHLKVVKLENEIFIDISNKDIHATPEKLKGFEGSDHKTLIIFGEKSIVKYDLLNPERSKHIATPFKIEGGIVSDDRQRVYIIANLGAKIGLIDFAENKFIGSGHTGSKAKKFNNFLFNLATMSITGASSNYMLIPGIKFSSNTLMLSKNQEILFAINTKTDDVTVFNAQDLSNKRIYPTGKRTFQILQAGDDLPIVVISQKQVSYFDAQTGDLFFLKTYDRFVKITDDLDLIYIKDKTQHSISLYDIDSSN